MNKKNILRVADAIEKGELVKRGIGFNMQVMTATTNHYLCDRLDSCGTVACLAGWAHGLRYPRRSINRLIADAKIETDAETGDFGGVTWVSGAEFLGLDFDQAHELFLPSGVGPWDKITPAHAVAVLRHLAETGEVDWTVGAP
jgi:hypothetical protein